MHCLHMQHSQRRTICEKSLTVAHLLYFLQQHAISHELDARLLGNVAFVTNQIRHLTETHTKNASH